MWESCCFLAMPNDGTVLGNVSGGGGVLGKLLVPLSPFFLSSLLSLSPFPSLPLSHSSLFPSLSLSPSPVLFRTLFSSLSLSLACGLLP